MKQCLQSHCRAGCSLHHRAHVCYLLVRPHAQHSLTRWPYQHVGTTDMIALVQQQAAATMLVSQTTREGRQLAYAYTSDTRANSDDIGRELSSRPGPAPQPDASITFSMESAGDVEYALVLYSNVSSVASFSEPLGAIIAARAFYLSDFLSHVPPDVAGSAVFFGLVCPPVKISRGSLTLAHS